MRWADLDQQGHVNNVVYVDYLQEARVDLLRTHSRREVTGELAEGLVVVRHDVQFLSPLTFDFTPVLIECWVTELRAASFTMAYEIYREPSAGSGRATREVYCRATTVLTPYLFSSERPRRLHAEEREALTVYLEDPPEWARPSGPRPAPVPRTDLGHHPVRVRFSDVDVYGHVNNVKYFEYFMDARILLLTRLWGLGADTPRPALVVARTEVDYRVPILFRPEPYDAWSTVTRVGATSVGITSEICDGEVLLSRARVVVVIVDDAGRPAPIEPSVRAALAAHSD